MVFAIEFPAGPQSKDRDYASKFAGSMRRARIVRSLISYVLPRSLQEGPQTARPSGRDDNEFGSGAPNLQGKQGQRFEDWKAIVVPKELAAPPPGVLGKYVKGKSLRERVCTSL